MDFIIVDAAGVTGTRQISESRVDGAGQPANRGEQAGTLPSPPPLQRRSGAGKGPPLRETMREQIRDVSDAAKSEQSRAQPHRHSADQPAQDHPGSPCQHRARRPSTPRAARLPKPYAYPRTDQPTPRTRDHRGPAQPAGALGRLATSLRTHLFLDLARINVGRGRS